MSNKNANMKGSKINQKSIFNKELVSGEKAWIVRAIIAVVIIVAIVGFVIIANKNTQTETDRERADLLAMQCADVTARQYVNAGLVKEETSYWYDALSFSLEPITSNAPSPYGMGKAEDAKEKEKFDSEVEYDFDYDGAKDYTKMVIKVTIIPKEEKIVIEWVTP